MSVNGRKFKIGDIAVPLSPKQSWRNAGPSYVYDMDSHAGHKGKIVNYGDEGTKVYNLRFSNGDTFWYRESWLEPPDHGIFKDIMNIVEKPKEEKTVKRLIAFKVGNSKSVIGLLFPIKKKKKKVVEKKTVKKKKAVTKKKSVWDTGKKEKFWHF